MTERRRRGPATDAGASLILAIAFVLVVGMISAGLVGLTTSSLANRNTLQVVRNRQYAADAAIEQAITEARQGSCTSGGGVLPAASLNDVTIRVEWTNACGVIQTDDGIVVAQRDVVFSACETASLCTDMNTVVRAVVNFQQVGGGAARTIIQSWSVAR